MMANEICTLNRNRATEHSWRYIINICRLRVSKIFVPIKCTFCQRPFEFLEWRTYANQLERMFFGLPLAVW